MYNRLGLVSSNSICMFYLFTFYEWDESIRLPKIMSKNIEKYLWTYGFHKYYLTDTCFIIQVMYTYKYLNIKTVYAKIKAKIWSSHCILTRELTTPNLYQTQSNWQWKHFQKLFCYKICVISCVKEEKNNDLYHHNNPSLFRRITTQS